MTDMSQLATEFRWAQEMRSGRHEQMRGNWGDLTGDGPVCAMGCYYRLIGADPDTDPFVQARLLFHKQHHRGNAYASVITLNDGRCGRAPQSFETIAGLVDQHLANKLGLEVLE